MHGQLNVKFNIRYLSCVLLWDPTSQLTLQYNGNSKMSVTKVKSYYKHYR